MSEASSAEMGSWIPGVEAKWRGLSWRNICESLVKLREVMRLSRRRVEGGIRKKFRKE